MAALWVAGDNGEAVAHRIVGEGDDGNFDELPVEDHKAMVGERQEGGLVQVPHRCEDQGP